MLLSPVAGENSSLGHDARDSELDSGFLRLNFVVDSVVFGILMNKIVWVVNFVLFKR